MTPTDTPSSAKRLVLIRHATAESGVGMPDHDRSLTEQGRREAAAVGRWLVAQGITCDLVLCSTAARTRQTWGAAASAGAVATRVEHLRAIYQGGLAGVLSSLAEDTGSADTAERLATVAVVGHAPTMPILAALLTDGRGLARAQEALAAGFPTAGVAVLRYAGPWAELAPGTAELVDFVSGRG